MKVTFFDKFFIALILSVSLAGFVVNLRLDAGAEQRYITVYVDNVFVKEISFNEQTEHTVKIPFGDGGEHHATLEISEGRVRMLPIDPEHCPRGICSHTGWISRNYQSIVCVPNRIIVSFADQSIEGIDGVTY